MAEKKKSSSKKSNKVMDIAKPGKTAPSASSRPIIVGHKPTVQDPMVNEGKEMPAGESEEHKIDVKRVGSKVIKPLSSAEDLEKDKEPVAAEETAPESEESAADNEQTSEDAPEVAETPAEAEDSPAEEPESEVLPEEPAGEEPPTKEPKESKASKDKGSSAVDAVANEAAKNKDKKADKKNEELQKRLAEVEKLVDDKKYFVHTSQTTKQQRRTRWAAIILALLLLAGAYLAVDAQVIKNDLWLPYEFFKEKQQPEPTASSQPTNNQPATSTPEERLATKEYVDSAKVFSFSYPSDWTVKLQEWIQDEGSTQPAPDWNKVSRGVSVLPAKGQKDNNVVVSGSSCEITNGAGEKVDIIEDLKANKDKFHTQQDVTIHDYIGFYDKTAFEGDAESYLEHTYVVKHGAYCVSFTYRENHHHEMSDTNFDDKENIPEFEAIVKSIKFLK